MGCVSWRAASFRLPSWEASLSGRQHRAKGGGRALLRNAPGSLPAEQSRAGCREPLKVGSPLPPLNFQGRVVGSQSACMWWEWTEQAQILCLLGSYFAGLFSFFFLKMSCKLLAACFLMENTNRLGSIPSLLPIMRKLHLLSPAILRKSFAVIPTNPITDCWVASGVSLLRSVTSLSRAYVFQFVMWSEPL